MLFLILKLILIFVFINLYYKNLEYMCMNIEGGSYGKKKVINN